MRTPSCTLARDSISYLEVGLLVAGRGMWMVSTAPLFPVAANGSGKSSIVCALCLGLGGTPKNMERGKSLGEFVLQGRPRAIIRITLQGRAAEHGDVTVELTIKAIKGPSAHSWVVNGKPRSDDDVRALLPVTVVHCPA